MRLPILLLILFSAFGTLKADPGDTTIVQAFTYGSDRDDIISFPDDGKSYERILMHYTLRCVPGGAGGLQYPCGEWDYLTYTNLYDDNGERFEIGRYITPYGIGIDLGDGWTWIFDVTDYATLLRGDKRLTAGNWQELLDLKFLFIEGTPSREVLKIQNIHTGRYDYRNSDDANQALEEKTIDFLPDTRTAKVKIRNSGHGFGGNLNCSEFCPRNNDIVINGQVTHNQNLWRGDCALNPLKGQGGTWVYNRANWCPGDKVNADEFEITEFVDFTQSTSIDYHLQDGYTWNGNGSVPYYRIETQLVEYGDLNHEVDLRIEDIIAPNSEEIYGNENPLCGQPIIQVTNAGRNDIDQILIEYGIQGSITSQYLIENANLSFDETAQFQIPPITEGTWPRSDTRKFFVQILEVNGSPDDYRENDLAVSDYVPSLKMNQDYEGFIISVQTNNNGNETRYLVRDGSGEILLDRSALASNTAYHDTFFIDQGCFEFEILDAGNDGLEWWANSAQGSGYAIVKGLFRGFGLSFTGVDPDFGRQSKIQFSLGETITNSQDPELKNWDFSILPNPSNGLFAIQMNQLNTQPITMNIRDALGISMINQTYDFNGVLDIDARILPTGLYWIEIQQGEYRKNKKLIIRR
jgi:hypothetical protein